MTRYWCELAWLGGPRTTQGVVIEVKNGRISAITSDQVAPPAGSYTACEG